MRIAINDLDSYLLANTRHLGLAMSGLSLRGVKQTEIRLVVVDKCCSAFKIGSISRMWRTSSGIFVFKIFSTLSSQRSETSP